MWPKSEELLYLSGNKKRSRVKFLSLENVRGFLEKECEARLEKRMGEEIPEKKDKGQDFVTDREFCHRQRVRLEIHFYSATAWNCLHSQVL